MNCRFVIHCCLLIISGGWLLFASPAQAQVSVLSYHNDLASTGRNLGETHLTPSAVNVATFGKIYAAAVDGQVYAQPLYVPGVNVAAGPLPGVHDVVYVATQHDSLYAFDATSGVLLWQVSVIDNAHGETPMPGDDSGTADLYPEIGITSTPVIPPGTDLADGRRYLYLVAKSARRIDDRPHYFFRLHAIDIATGQEKPGSPVTIAETVQDFDSSYIYISGPSVAGTGDGAISGRVGFNAMREHQRCGLSLVNGSIYIAFASHGDNGPYHGWLLGYNAQTLQPSAVFNTTPNGGEAGIWMSGGIVSTDGSGALYAITGNGTFAIDNINVNPSAALFDSAGFPRDRSFGNCFLKLVPDGTTAANPNQNGWGLRVADYFCPFNQNQLNNGDVDLGSGGVLILPDSAGSAAHPHLLIGAGKEGRIYLIDRDNMGKFRGGIVQNQFVSNGDKAVQVTGPNAINGCLSTPAFFNGTLFFAGAYINDHGKAFTIANGVLNATPIAQTPDSYGYLGATPSVSANGANNGIVWCIDRGTNQLRAYDTADFNRELYTSGQAPGGRDRLGTAVKFGVPTVANGLVFVGTSEAAGPSELVCYGQFSPPSTPPAQPVSLYAQTISGGEIDLFWTDHADNEVGYEVYVSLNPNSFPNAPYATTAANAVSCAVVGLQVNTTYYFRVRAVNAVGASAYSNTAATTSAQAPPVDFTNGFNGQAGLLTFNGYAEGQQPIIGSVLRLMDAADGARSVWLNTAQNIRQFSAEFTFRIANPEADGFTFTIQRAGLDALGISGGSLGYEGISQSAAVKFDIYPDLSTTGLYLNGAGPDDNDQPTKNSSGAMDVTGAGITFHSTHVFKVTLTYDGAVLREVVTDTVTGSSFSTVYPVDLPAVIEGDTAYIGFTGSAGELTSVQDIQTWSFIPSLPTAPLAPTDLTAAPASGTQINLTWTDQSDNETGFRVERRDTPGGSFAPIGSVGANTALYVDANLLADTTYSYRVVAANVGFNSAPSNEVTLTTPIAPTTPSGAIPTRLSANEIDFRWNDNSDNETGFRILRQVNDTGFYILATVPSNTTSYADKNLQPDTDYDYHIQAFNAAGYVDFAGFGTATPSGVNIVASDAQAQVGTANGAAFAVRRSNAKSTPLTVHYTIQKGAGQAAYGGRYTLDPAPDSAMAGSVTIPAGSPAATIIVNPTADAAVFGAQSVTLTLADGEGYTALGTGQAAAQLSDSPANTWRIQQFGSVLAAQSPLAADAADYDSDGISNLMEYALGSNPMQPASAAVLPAPKAEFVDGDFYLTLTFRRLRPAPLDVSYLPETAADLTVNTWQSAVIVSGYPVDNGDGTETMKARAAQPIGAIPKGFIRLRVIR